MYAELLTVSYSTSTWTRVLPHYLFSVIIHLFYNSMLYSLNYWQHHKIPLPKILNFSYYLHGKIITPIFKHFIRQNTQVNRILWGSLNSVTQCVKPLNIYMLQQCFWNKHNLPQHTQQCLCYSATTTVLFPLKWWMLWGLQTQKECY